MWALMNLDGSLKEERYATYDEAADAYLSTYLMSAALDIVEVI